MALTCSAASLSRKRAEVAESDPLVRAGVVRFEVLEWVLVAFNPDAIDRSALLYP